MPDLELNDLLERAHQSKSRDVRDLASKIERIWNDGVVPGPSIMTKLHKALQTEPPCDRLQHDGKCDGWLTKYGFQAGVTPLPGSRCPYASNGRDASVTHDCPGYRKPKP